MPPDPLIGFWLVYTENVRSVLLLVPQSEAFALPGIVERANLQRPHEEYAMYPFMTLTCHVRWDIHIHVKHLPFASFLTIPESCEVSDCQERASSKRFPLCLTVPPALPLTGPLRFGLRMQSYKIILYASILFLHKG